MTNNQIDQSLSSHQADARLHFIRMALVEAENRGHSQRTPEEIRAAAKMRMKKNGQL
jgi:hypothetical protein